MSSLPFPVNAGWIAIHLFLEGVHIFSHFGVQGSGSRYIEVNSFHIEGGKIRTSCRKEKTGMIRGKLYG
jgi:hypothetical protein